MPRISLLCSTVFIYFLLALSLAGQEGVAARGPIPAGWFKYPAEKLERLDQDALRCFNYSQNEWKVSSDGAVVRITRLVRRSPRVRDESDELPLPRLAKHEPGMPGRTVRFGLRAVLHFRNGWLLAYDAGEFGGGLWLTNEDGSKTRRILSDNVTEMVRVGDEVLVLSGLDHGTMDFGNAFLFSEPEGLNISLQHFARLNGAPRGYVKEQSGSVLFVTTAGLCRITKSGEVAWLTDLPRWSQHGFTNSMAITSDGSIFIGMRMFVLRLIPNAGGYKQGWLLPENCQTFSVREYECVCHQ